MRRFSVPANLLLCGEYAITRPGGLGVACALERRVLCRVTPADAFLFEGITPETRYRWGPDGDGGSLPAAILAACSSFLPSGHPPAVNITVDSSALFSSKGDKLGLGSSAAVSVALAIGVFYAVYQKEELPQEVCTAALIGHRRWQGGGSGYDILTSFYGGCGLFTGGEAPGWEQLSWDPAWHLALIRGEGPQSSRSAGTAFREWLDSDPLAGEHFLANSNQAASRFAAAVREGRLSSSEWAMVRKVGMDVGRAIGVPADIPLLLHRLPGGGASQVEGKASGAGAELGVAFWADKHYPFGKDEAPGLKEVSVSPEGIRWLQ